MVDNQHLLCITRLCQDTTQIPHLLALQLWDLRNLKRTGEIQDAHMMPARSVDFAHQQPHRMVTGGDDCQVCIWDLRYVFVSTNSKLGVLKKHFAAACLAGARGILL